MTADERATLTAPAESSGPPFARGEVLADRYTVEVDVGEGAYGWIVSAWDVEAAPPRRVAIKVLKPERAADLDRFERRELELLWRVHEAPLVANVVRPLEREVMCHRGSWLIVLEFVEGPLLRERMTGGRAMAPEEARFISLGIARGLAAIHAAGGVHRDLKPSNVRLRRGMEPVILDAGAAKAMWETQEITQAGRAPMTPLYASPEQLADGDVGVAADVYALGVILHEMLTGALPPAGAPDARTFAVRLRRAAGFGAPGSLLFERLGALALRCLERDPARRPAAAEVAALLAAPSPPPVRPLRRRLVVAALVLAVLAGAWATSRIASHFFTRLRPDNGLVERNEATTLASEQPFPFSIAVDGRHVFWVNRSRSGAVMKVPLEGGSPREIDSDLPWLLGVAVDADNVYWSSDEGLTRAPMNGGRSVPLTAARPTSRPLVIGAGHVYWTEDEKVAKVPFGGGSPVPLASSDSEQLLANTVAIDDDNAYWVSSRGGTVMKVSIHGGSPTVLAEGQRTPVAVAAGASFVYWVNAHDGTVMKVPARGGAPVVLATDAPGSDAMAIDETHVYWVNPLQGNIARVPIEGGPAVTIARGEANPRAIAVDASHVYWVNHAIRGTVRRIAK